MTDSVRDLLIGYLLGALEPAEHEAVETHLAKDPELRRALAVLRKALEPLDAARQDFPPPAGLAARTNQYIAAEAARPRKQASSKSFAGMTPEVDPPSWASRFRWQDLVTAAGFILAAVLLLFPAIQNSREQARLLACQDNLRELGGALGQYSQRNGGFFPRVPAQGNLAAAGIYAPTLLKEGFLSDPRHVVCPASPLADNRQFRVPSFAEIQSTGIPKQRQVLLRRNMGGSYGYNLGYVKDGKLQGTKNLGRTHFAVMADAPHSGPDGPRSLNHGGKGQNVLFEDGHVAFRTTSKVKGETVDDIYLNDDGQIAAGKHENDAVLGASTARPVIRLRIHFRRVPRSAIPATEIETKSKKEANQAKPDPPAETFQLPTE